MFYKSSEVKDSEFVSTKWQAFLWNIYAKFSAKLVGVKDSHQLPEKLSILQWTTNEQEDKISSLHCVSVLLDQS